MRKKTIKKKFSIERKVVINDESHGYESFEGTIELLKQNALDKNVLLSNKDIASAISIPHEQFETYMKSDKAPSEIFSLLRLAFIEYLSNKEVYTFVFTEEIPDPFWDELKKNLGKK